MASSGARSISSNRSKAWSATGRPDRRIADSSRRSPYVSGGPQWTWKRPLVSTPPMSMHSIGHAWAHWKHVSHLSVPHSSYSSCRRPRYLGATSAGSSGYMIVALGAKNLPSVTPMPRTMPMPGMRLIGRSPRLDGLDHDDGGRRDEQVEQRCGQQPFPREAHEVVDAHARQRAAHPHEEVDEQERFEHEPEDPGEPGELQVHEAEQRADGDHVEREEAEDQRLPAGHPALRQVERRGEQQGQDRRHDRNQDQEADAERTGIQVELDVRERDGGVPRPEEERHQQA